MIGSDRVGDLLEERRLAGFRRRDDERALALADRAEEIEDASAHLERRRLHLQPDIGIDGDELVEDSSTADRFRILAVDRLDLEDAVILLVVFRIADLTGDEVAGAQLEATDLRLRDVDVARTRPHVLAAQEAVAFG